jgi:hypothetical protein
MNPRPLPQHFALAGLALLFCLTNGEVQVRVYWGGAAGDDKDVLRKMRAGQIDGTALGLDVMSQVVREAMVLATPGLYTNYKQVDAVRAELTPDFDAEAYPSRRRRSRRSPTSSAFARGSTSRARCSRSSTSRSARPASRSASPKCTAGCRPA